MYYRLTVGGCRRPMSAGSATAFAAFVTNLKQATTISSSWTAIYKLGLPTLKTPILGDCAIRYSRVVDMILPSHPTSVMDQTAQSAKNVRHRSLTIPLWCSRLARRLLEQQSQERPCCQPQQEQHRQPEQQQRVPYRQYTSIPEPMILRDRRVRLEGSRSGHDDTVTPLLRMATGRACFASLQRDRHGCLGGVFDCGRGVCSFTSLRPSRPRPEPKR